MSLSSSSATDECSSAGGESTGRVVREEVPPESKSSSATPSCMNDSNGAPAVDVPQEFEFIEPQRNFRPGYQWVNSKVREYFSKYRSANELRSFFPILKFIILILKMISFHFGVLEMLIMFVMAEKVIAMNFFIFMLVFSEIFIFDCL